MEKLKEVTQASTEVVSIPDEDAKESLDAEININGCCSDEGIDADSQSEKTHLTTSISITMKELEAVKLRNSQLIEENNVLSCKVQNLEQQRLDLEQRQARLQESNSEHLHQIATLQSELAATESLKSQLARYAIQICKFYTKRILFLVASCKVLLVKNSELSFYAWTLKYGALINYVIGNRREY